MRKRTSKRKKPIAYRVVEVVPEPAPRGGTLIALDNHWSSWERRTDPHNHQWQRGHHIDSLPK